MENSVLIVRKEIEQVTRQREKENKKEQEEKTRDEKGNNNVIHLMEYSVNTCLQ